MLGSVIAASSKTGHARMAINKEMAEQNIQTELFEGEIESAWKGDWLDYYGDKIDAEKIVAKMEQYKLKLNNGTIENHDSVLEGFNMKESLDEQIRQKPIPRNRRPLLPPIPFEVQREVQIPNNRAVTDLDEPQVEEKQEEVRPRRPLDLTIGTNPEILNRFNRPAMMNIDDLVFLV